MLKIESGRLHDPKFLSPIEIAKECEARGRLIVQFSRPDAYTPEILASLNEACRLVKNRLQVRFFGHYDGRFDAKTLRHLPEIRNLAVDCLTAIDNEDEIGQLPNLRSLGFGVFELDRPDFLRTIELRHLERLSLGENRKRNFDLSPLADCGQLGSLFIQGHSNGIDGLADLPRLGSLTLSSYAQKHALNFVNGISTLKELKLILGGRADLHDLSSESLEILQVIRVKGLARMGDLSRLPALTALRIEDQIQLKQVDLKGARLKRLALINCKNLTELPGLEQQDQLREFSAFRVALDLDGLRDREWPSATRSVRLFSGNNTWNEDAAARLTARNLTERGEDLWL
ncbi:leucine-rich repeat domain-containing protein [Roseibium suaedae]|uniref:Leucine-rich repeat domain-containing protein n=1 Tax=Roseibium suaedae TaxID=735517 RepID=A0A1M7P9J0_9HYPH|nr:hypothetical protein [Roseibium suaedae]SHN12907.1 hypothetical protein SAMN05444272_4195 [Roseibium suaedae]